MLFNGKKICNEKLYVLEQSIINELNYIFLQKAVTTPCYHKLNDDVFL